MKILVVEDDKRLAATVKRGLEQEGYAVDVALDGTDGQWMATEQDYDAIVLDVMLPGINGYRVCAGLREAGDWTPILMLTAKRGEYDEAEALDTGADDFLSKPFSFVVLLARLRALVRRGRAERPAVIEVGDLRLDPAAHQCRARRAPRSRSARASSRCSSTWRAAPATAVSKRELLEHVWDFAFEGDDNIVEVYVRRLRRKIDEPVRAGDDPDGSRRGVPDRPSMRRWFATVRVRTTVFATLVVTAALVAGAILLLVVQQRGARRRTRAAALAIARADVAALAKRGALPPVLTAAKEDEAFTQVVDANGTGARGEQEPPQRRTASSRRSRAPADDLVIVALASRRSTARFRIVPRHRRHSDRSADRVRGRQPRDGRRRDPAPRDAAGDRPPAARRTRRAHDVAGHGPGAATGGGDPLGGRRDREGGAAPPGARTRHRTTRSAGSPGR